MSSVRPVATIPGVRVQHVLYPPATSVSYVRPCHSTRVALNAGYTVSVRRTRLNVLVLLTLALAGESPTCTLHEGIHIPYHARSKYHTQLAKLSFDLKKTFSTISQLKCIFSFFKYPELL